MTHSFYLTSKKTKIWVTIPIQIISMWSVDKSLKWWGNKAKGRIAHFWKCRVLKPCSRDEHILKLRGLITTGGSRTAATSKMEHFVITVNGFQPLTIITKRCILDVAAVLDPPLITMQYELFLAHFHNFSCIALDSNKIFILNEEFLKPFGN